MTRQDLKKEEIAFDMKLDAMDDDAYEMYFEDIKDLKDPPSFKEWSSKKLNTEPAPPFVEDPEVPF